MEAQQKGSDISIQALISMLSTRAETEGALNDDESDYQLIDGLFARIEELEDFEKQLKEFDEGINTNVRIRDLVIALKRRYKQAMKDRQRGYARQINGFLTQLRGILTQVREMDEYHYGKIFMQIKDEKEVKFESKSNLNDDDRDPTSLRSEPMAPLSPSMYKAMQSDKKKIERSKSHRSTHSSKSNRSTKSMDSAKSTHVSYVILYKSRKNTFVSKIEFVERKSNS